MFFYASPNIIGSVMSAEGIRKCQAGSLMMACFIDTASGYWENIPNRLNDLVTYNIILDGLLLPMAVTQRWAVPAYWDLITGIE